MEQPLPAWERLRELGPLTAFFRTVWDVVSRPVSFFEALPAGGPVPPAVLFWALTTLPPMVVSGMQANSFLNEVISITMTSPRPGYLQIPWWVLTVAAPLLQFVSLLTGLAVVHMLLQMMGRAGGGWRGTFRAGGYASGPAVFGFVPLVGAPLAAVWVAVLQFVALKRVHRVPAWVLLLAYMLPVLAILLIGVAVLLIVISFVSPDLLNLQI